MTADLEVDEPADGAATARYCGLDERIGRGGGEIGRGMEMIVYA
jgi:hypothetical protein